MFCPHCGTQVPDGSHHCTQCGVALNAQQPAPASAQPQTPPADFKDYQTINIILAIVSFLCCGGWIGVIFGVLGIVFGSQAKSAFQAGNYAEAQAKAKSAKLMSILAMVMVGIGAIATIVLLLIYGAGIFAMIAAELNLILAL